VLINTQTGPPRVICPLSVFEFQLFIENLMSKPGGTTVSLLYAFEILKVLTGPSKPPSKPLTGFKAFTDSLKGLSEDLLTARTAESSLKDMQINPSPSYGLVCDFNPSAIVHRPTWCGTFGTNFELRLFTAFVMGPELAMFPVSQNFQFWQKYKTIGRFPIGIHSDTSFSLKFQLR
jgi:hypothetical protein